MRNYDNERLNRRLKKLPYRRQRRAAQGYRFSTLEPEARRQEARRLVFTRQDELIFINDPQED